MLNILDFRDPFVLILQINSSLFFSYHDITFQLFGHLSQITQLLLIIVIFVINHRIFILAHQNMHIFVVLDPFLTCFQSGLFIFHSFDISHILLQFFIDLVIDLLLNTKIDKQVLKYDHYKHDPEFPFVIITNVTIAMVVVIIVVPELPKIITILAQCSNIAFLAKMVSTSEPKFIFGRFTDTVTVTFGNVIAVLIVSPISVLNFGDRTTSAFRIQIGMAWTALFGNIIWKGAFFTRNANLALSRPILTTIAFSYLHCQVVKSIVNDLIIYHVLRIYHYIFGIVRSHFYFDTTEIYLIVLTLCINSFSKYYFHLLVFSVIIFAFPILYLFHVSLDNLISSI